jgi:hypothetical protein
MDFKRIIQEMRDRMMPEERTKIQWVQAGSWSFFAPVPDPDYGWRLHMVDLAVNKALAAGGRKEVRDYVDLMLIHRHIMPLSRIIHWSCGVPPRFALEA